MRLFRVFPYAPSAASGELGHPLFVPRSFQGGGRHDNPDPYGALYLSQEPTAAVAEHIAHLRGQSLADSDLDRGGLRLAIVELDAPIERRMHDLDEPRVLAQWRLRPSEVATRRRSVTQRWAARVYRGRGSPWGVRWWSKLEASWLHVTLFDRAVDRLGMRDPPERLTTGHSAVQKASEELGIEIA